MVKNHISWLMLLVLAALAPRPTSQEHNCDAACQALQRQALLRLYNSTHGSSWYPADSAYPESSWGSGANATGLDVPAHCLWSGVACCGSSGYLLGFGTDIMTAFTRTVKCSSPNGVTLLQLLGRYHLAAQAGWLRPFTGHCNAC